MKTAYAAAVGGANLDIHSHLLGPARLRDSNPGHVSLSAGGVGRNIAENLARLGVPVKLLTALGDDAFGDSILAVSRRAGIDVSAVCRIPGKTSSLYLDITDHDGDMYLASSDMRVLDELPSGYFEKNRCLLENAAVIVADGNLSPAQLDSLLAAKGETRLAADPVSTKKAEKFIPLLDRIYFIKPNRMELEVLSGLSCPDTEAVKAASAAVLQKGCHSVAVSLGADGCYYADRDGVSFFLPAIKAEATVNTTGAGDAFMAGWTAGILRGFPPEQCAQAALACGALAAASEDTISGRISPAILDGIIL